LQALEESVHAFGTTYSEAAQWELTRWEAQVIEFATFVAVVHGRDVGVARGATHRELRMRELISMWVAPAARRQGIGALLIESVAAWATAAGATRLVLDVVAANGSAICLYERAGFQMFDGDVMGERAPNEIRFVRSLSRRAIPASPSPPLPTFLRSSPSIDRSSRGALERFRAPDSRPFFPASMSYSEGLANSARTRGCVLTRVGADQNPMP
jgi:GNAT superfamily N-acetyltransferase